MANSSKKKTVYTITLTHIKRKPEQILDKLERDFSTSSKDSINTFESLPYHIANQFNTMAEAKRVIREYSQLGCTLVLNTHHIEVNEGSPVNSTSTKKENISTDKETQVDEESAEPASLFLNRYLLIAITIIVLLVLVYSLSPTEWKTIPRTGGEEVIGAHNEGKDGAKKFKYRLSSAHKKIIANLDLNLSLPTLIKKVYKLPIKPNERKQVSEHYSEKANTDKNPELSANIKFLKVAIAFNQNNEKAWVKLVNSYRALGDEKMLKETQQQMKEIFPDAKLNTETETETDTDTDSKDTPFIF